MRTAAFELAEPYSKNPDSFQGSVALPSGNEVVIHDLLKKGKGRIVVVHTSAEHAALTGYPALQEVKDWDETKGSPVDYTGKRVKASDIETGERIEPVSGETIEGATTTESRGD